MSLERNIIRAAIIGAIAGALTQAYIEDPEGFVKALTKKEKKKKVRKNVKR